MCWTPPSLRRPALPPQATTLSLGTPANTLIDAHCKYLTTIHKADGFAFSYLGGDSSDA